MHTYLYSCVFNARGQESGGNWGNSLVKTRPYMVRFHTLSLTERTTYGICLCPKSFFKLCFHKISFFRRGQLILNGCHSTKIKWWNSPLHNYTYLWAEEVSHFVVRRKCSNERVVHCYGYWMAQAGWQAREGQRENERDLECMLYVFCCDWATH